MLEELRINMMEARLKAGAKPFGAGQFMNHLRVFTNAS